MNTSFFPRLLHRIQKKARSFFILDQWEILVAKNTDHTSLAWEKFKRLTPPMDRFWADPFIWFHEGRAHIFIEELLFSTHRGRIACLTLDEELNIAANRTVLERPYHLSYPFLFEHGGQLYMIPETKQNNTIEVYRCARFPDQWSFEKTLMNNLRAVDATLLNAHGRWWLFANVQEESGSSWDTLNLYFSDDPLSSEWTPHPGNPIVKDITSARPAGRIFFHNGRLIRPSQDCSTRYGYAVHFNEITALTETNFQEARLHTFKPPAKGPILATHTYNAQAGLTVMDAIVSKSRFQRQSTLLERRL